VGKGEGSKKGEETSLSAFFLKKDRNPVRKLRPEEGSAPFYAFETRTNLEAWITGEETYGPKKKEISKGKLRNGGAYVSGKVP